MAGDAAADVGGSRLTAMTTACNRAVALLGMRLILASITMWIGYHKIAGGLDTQLMWFKKLNQWFPWWFLIGVNFYTAYVELVAGAALLVGIARNATLYLILSVLVIVSIGHSIEHMVWDMHQMVFRMLFLATLLLVPAEWDRYRLNAWLPWRARVGVLKDPQAR